METFDDDANDEQKTEVERVLRRKPHRGFDGAESKGRARDAPIQFEKSGQNIVNKGLGEGGVFGGTSGDGFGMDAFMKPQKKFKK